MPNLYEDDKGLADLYVHMDENEATFIARYSSEGGDYSSGSCFCWSNPHLNKALRLAYEQGLLKGELLINLISEQQRWLNYCEVDSEYKRRVDDRFTEERFFLPA